MSDRRGAPGVTIFGAPAPKPAAGSDVAEVESVAGATAAFACGAAGCAPGPLLSGSETVEEIPVAMMLMQMAANATNKLTASAIVFARDWSGRFTGA